MEAAHMTFEEEVVRSRRELRHLRQENARFRIANQKLHEKVARLTDENRTLRSENTLLSKQQEMLHKKIQQQEKQLESLSLLIEELRRMVFGKKSKQEIATEKQTADETGADTQTDTKKPRKKADRNATSYRRPAPLEEDVTDVYEHTMSHCPDCGTLLTHLKTIIRYLEDIQDLTQLAALLKRVEKHIITTGYCGNCKKRRVAVPIAPQVCLLGENSKKFITYLIVIMRQSFEQVRCFLTDTADLSISDGEIVLSLDRYAEKLKPEKERIRQRIRGAPGRHYDETGWPVQHGGQGNYGWATTPTEGEDTLFLLGRSRGKGVAKELRGEEDNQVGVTDDYAAYDNLFTYHQLCMSHPQRKLRDLHESKTLINERKVACTNTFIAFSRLYKELEETLKTPYQKERWLLKREEYLKRLRALAILTEDDPDKLQRIKRTLAEKAGLYFTCLLKPGIPADNNKEERKVRHLVLKRNNSQGSKSDKGAKTMSILCTTLLSAWWKKPDNFFVAYNQILEA